jgi:serine/threonine protein kinase/Tfp pilus assembly protein PilF
MAFPQGTKIGRYEIQSELGSGGMGVVYLALDTRLNRKIALKLLPADLTDNKDRLDRFEQEARAASALNHPNILTIHEIGTDNGTHFIATEFVEGETLRALIMMDAPMRPSVALDLAIQVAAALSAAHAAGIVHRDVKPENVMLRTDGYVKVLDFGLAKLIETEKDRDAADPNAPTQRVYLTNPGVVMGTAKYMSPEQASGKTVDGRTDIWSLGVILYEMLTGRHPFDGEMPTQIIARVLEREPEPLGSRGTAVPAELQRIVSKALMKDRGERYRDIKDLLRDLKALKQDLEFDARLGRSGSSSGQSEEEEAQEAPSGEKPAGERVAPAPSGTTKTLSNEAVSTHGSGSRAVAAKPKSWPNRLALVAGLVAVAGLALGLWLYLRARNADAAIDSVAVLPFVNQNSDPNMEYLSDGLTESTINSLAQLPNMRVIARSSVFRYKGREIDPVQVARELGVRAVFTGRIAQRGDDLIISVELVDTGQNKQLWGETYDRKVSDLLVVQRDIAREISANLRTRLTPPEESLVTKRYTENPEAYQLYLKGRFYWNKRTGEAFKRAIEYFNGAIEQDPSYALAYAGLADTYILLSRYSAGTPEESYPKAKAAAQRALAIDETLAEAHNSLAGVLLDYDWNLAESDKEYRRAIELNPNYATARHWYANGPLLVTERYDEAIAEMKRAVELDPLSLIINSDLGSIYLDARQYDRAVEQLRKTIDMDRGFYPAHYWLGEAYVMKGSYADAIAEYQKARELNDDPLVLGLLGHAYAVSGRRDEALRMLDELNKLAQERYVSSYTFALVYAGLNDRDQAFQWLEKSYRDRSSEIAYFKVDPLLDPLRPDPRFADLVRRVGL